MQLLAQHVDFEALAYLFIDGNRLVDQKSR
jgi:hypothetical protein